MSIMRQISAQAALEGIEYSADSFAEAEQREEILHQLSDFHSAHRALEIHGRSADALESLYERVRQFEGSPVNRQTAQMMHLSYQSAIQGLEQYHQSLPSLECFSGPMPDRALVISTEAIGDALKRAIEIVVQAVRKILKMIQTFMERLGPHLRMLYLRLMHARKRAREINGKIANTAALPLGSRWKWLSTEKEPSADGAQLARHLDHFTQHYKIINDNYVDYIEQIAYLYSQRLSDVRDENDAQQAIAQLTALIEKLGPQTFANRFKGARVISDGRWRNGATATVSEPLLGQKSLIVIDGLKQDTTGGDQKTKLAVLQKSHIDFDTVDLWSTNNDFTHKEMRLLNASEIEQLTAVCEQLLGYVQHTVLSGRRLRITRTAEQIEAAASAVEKRINSAGFTPPETMSLVLLGRTLSKWLTSPYVQMTASASSILSAVIQTMYQHLDCYEKPES